MADETEQQPAPASTAIERARSAISRIEDLSYSDLLARLAGPFDRPTPPASPPTPTAITEAQQRAVARLTDVYGKVVPDERRLLTQDEAHAILDERLVLDLIVAMASTRKEAIRTTVFNHLDVVAEEAGFDETNAVRDAKGHWLLPGAIVDPPLGQSLTREVASSTVSLNPNDLDRLSKDEEAKAVIRKELGDPDWDFTHEDYLRMTEPVRVFSQEKAMLAIRKKPGLVAAMGHVTKTGMPVASIHVRKVKA